MREGSVPGDPDKLHGLWPAIVLPAFVAIAIMAFAGRPAHAVPAFSDQTGLACSACHVGGFGPQLTPLGREFKLNGYTMRAGRSIPLSAMAIASFTHTRKDQNPAPEGLDSNDNVAFDEGSLFLAGGVGQHLGGFAQITYDGIAKSWEWDNLDLRAVTKDSLFGADTTFGLTLNNSPTVQDVWNTTPVWGFPYTDTAVSNTPGAAPLIDDGLAQNTLGLGAYAWIGQKFYLEGGAYTTPSEGTLRWLGADPADPGNLKGVAPYGRIAWQTQAAGGTLELGAFALDARIYPGRDTSSGYTDDYTDLGADVSWQRTLSSGDVVSAQVRYVHERSRRRASCALGLLGPVDGPDCANVGLNEWRGDIGYHWHNKLGATVGAFSISGDSNPLLYGPTASPDSNGLMVQFDYSPWGDDNGPLGRRVNLQLGLQGVFYSKFDGARHNYDGAGANASDNDEVRAFAWLAF